MFDLNTFSTRQPTTTGLTGALTSAQLFSNTRVRFGRHSTMVLIPLCNVLYFRLQLAQTPTHERGVDGHASRYTLFSSYWLQLNFCPVVALDPSMLPTSLGHCLDTLSNYGSGREPCTDKAFSPRLGVLSGFVFQRRSPGDTTLSERGQTKSVP
jgi:hypothetical protein